MTKGETLHLINELGPDLDGLSQLRALMASGRKSGIMIALDFNLVEIEAEWTAGMISTLAVSVMRAKG